MYVLSTILHCLVPKSSVHCYTGLTLVFYILKQGYVILRQSLRIEGGVRCSGGKNFRIPNVSIFSDIFQLDIRKFFYILDGVIFFLPFSAFGVGKN